METAHIDRITREMFAEALRTARENSKDQRAQVILEVDGRLSVMEIQLAEFDWTHYSDVLAISFVNETDDPDEYAHHLYSPKHMAFQSSFGKQG